MKPLAILYRSIKTSIGGNREVLRFEHTFGRPFEEREHVTPVAAHQRRILGQLEFAIAMDHQAQGAYDAPIRDALEFLQARLDETGVISVGDAGEAEGLLAPLVKAAKEYRLILCAHAHIDMNWMWSWQETVAATLDTFRTMLAIMREYPQFTFSQSQSSVYRIVEDYEPSMMDEIKQRIREGRWEVTASAWVETDKNMPSTESLARHILYTKKYLSETWGVDPASLSIDFSPDTFGHSASLPELDAAGGIKYYYHCRGNDVTDPLYRWRAPSGREMIVYREPYWYNSGITPHIGAGLPELAKRSGGLKTGLIVYGVGDHGGGPTRRDVERAIEMQGWPVYPRINFGTFAEFYKEAESVRGELPLVDSEINFIFPGCYTTQSRIKKGNRHSEAALYEAEALGALAKVATGASYPVRQYEGAWRNVLFTHFHDILTGSCVQDTREHAMGLYSHALAVANTQRSQAMRALADAIDTSALLCDEDISASQSEGAGAGYGLEGFGPPVAERGTGMRRIFHIFNPSAHPRKAVAELTVWDWPGDLRRVELSDHEGNPLACQLLQDIQQKYWDHQFFKLLADVDLPAMGYATVVLNEGDGEGYPFYYHPAERSQKPYRNIVLENDCLRAEFCFRTGRLISLVEKASGIETLGAPAGLNIVECDGENDNAWIIGRYMSAKPLTERVKVKAMPCSGALRSGVIIEAPVMGSTATTVVTLDRHSAALSYDITVDWHEIAKDKGIVPTLIFSAPVSYDAREYLYDIPAGAQTRAPMHLDVPAQTYGAAVNPSGASLALTTDCKYGFRGADGAIAVTLIHSANAPDPYPERGIHRIRLALFAQKACPKAMKDAAFDAMYPPIYCSARAGEGTLGMEAALLELEQGSTAVVSAVKWAEDNSGAIVRLYETCGRETEAVLAFPKPVKTVCAVDILETPCAGEARADGAKAIVRIPACSLVAIKVEF